MLVRSLAIVLTLAVGSSARADIIYLAVGDSSAFGETDRTHNPSNGDRGYVAPFADYLGSRLGTRPAVVNTAINGETSKSFFTGLVSDRASTDGITLNSRYAPFAPGYAITQRDYMNSVIDGALAQSRDIKFVTVQLGANDLSNVGDDPNFLALPPNAQAQVVGQTIQTAAGNLSALLTDVRAKLPNADLYVIGYHNPYGGNPSHPLASLAAPALQGLNQAIGAVGSAYGAKFVNFYPVVLGRERQLTLIDRYPADNINYVHLNPSGYAAVSRVLIDAAADSPQLPPVPAPPAVILLALGAAGLGVRRLRKSA